MLQARERTLILFPSIVFTFGLVVEFIKEFGGAALARPKTKKIIMHISKAHLPNLLIYLAS